MENINLFEMGNRNKGEFPFYIYKYAREQKSKVFTPHWHEELELTVSTGSGSIKIEEECIEFKKGDILVISGGLLHSLETFEGATFHTVLFDLSLAQSLKDKRYTDDTANKIINHTLTPSPIVSYGQEGYCELRCIFETLYNLNEEQKNQNELMIISNIFSFLHTLKTFNLISEKGRFGNNVEITYLKNAVSYMEENYSKPLSVLQIASFVGLSEGYFTRIFKKQIKLSPIQYLNIMRLSYADKKLKEGLSVTEVAISNGFENVSYFIKQYKRQYGITPGKRSKQK